MCRWPWVVVRPLWQLPPVRLIAVVRYVWCNVPSVCMAHVWCEWHCSVACDHLWLYIGSTVCGRLPFLVGYCGQCWREHVHEGWLF